MICGVSVATIIFYGCIFIPLLRIKQDLLKIVAGLMFYTSSHDHDQEETCLLDLPVIRFEDLQGRRHGSVDETCFVCLAEFEKGDVVSQLSRCGHVFHTGCIQRWLHRNHHFNCPFCRSSLFNGAPSLRCK